MARQPAAREKRKRWVAMAWGNSPLPAHVKLPYSTPYKKLVETRGERMAAAPAVSKGNPRPRAQTKKLKGRRTSERNRNATNTVIRETDLPSKNQTAATIQCASGWYTRSTGKPKLHSGDQQSRGFSPDWTA